MNKGIALSVNNLCKVYEKNKSEKFYALQNLSFELRKGEMLGVIGRNGSGKTTLLKILSEITIPTSGSAEFNGILTSIIEIGTGFHADLSGKENIFLSAKLLGNSKKRIKEILPKIVEFSGLKDFLETPVKHYSSGMYLRLAFSIAFHSEIDVLLLDEVLAVGDAEFRRKCYSKIRKLKENGTSIIFVSHQMEPIVEFCDRCLWLDNGKTVIIGKPIDVIESYLENSTDSEGAVGNKKKRIERKEPSLDSLSDEFIKIKKIKIESQGLEDGKIYMNNDIEIILEYDKLLDEDSLEVVYSLINMNGVRVLLDSFGLRKEYAFAPMKAGSYQMKCTIPKNLLNRGTYRLGMIITRTGKIIFDVPEIRQFKVYPNNDLVFDVQISAAVRPHLKWETQSITD